MHNEDVKPNHHWSTHIFTQIIDYGPVYGFWSFTYERLNKVLKSYHTNNHGGGEIEVTFFRAFKRDVKLRGLVRNGSIMCRACEKLIRAPLSQLMSLSNPRDEDDEDEYTACLRNTVQSILATDGDVRGTVASLAREIEEFAEDGEINGGIITLFAYSTSTIAYFISVDTRFSLGPGAIQHLERHMQQHLLNFYRKDSQSIKICSRTSSALPTNAAYLSGSATFHSHIILDGRRIAPCPHKEKASNAIVQVDLNGTRYVGQVIAIITHTQSKIPIPTRTLLHVDWFVRCADEEIATTLWDP